MTAMITRYFVVGLRPVKHINLTEGGYLGSAYAFDWQNGSFRREDDYLDNIWGRPFKDEAEELTKEEFDRMVEHLRAERGLPADDGPAFEQGVAYYRDVLLKDRSG